MNDDIRDQINDELGLIRDALNVLETLLNGQDDNRLVVGVSTHRDLRETLEDALEFGNPVTFTYEKPSGDVSSRVVALEEVTEDRLVGVDFRDNRKKAFRLDRIEPGSVSVA